MATIALSKALGMDDYITNGTLREIEISKFNGGTTKQLGFLSQNVQSKYQSNNHTLFEGAELYSRESSSSTLDDGITSKNYELNELSKRDPRMGDKIVFDYLMGNTDRHGLNYFIQKPINKKDPTLSMKGFDNGLSFGNDNNRLHDSKGFGFNGRPSSAQNKLLKVSENTKITQVFKDTFSKFVKESATEGSDYKYMMSFIQEKIGTTEAIQFKKRVENMAKSILNKKHENLSQTFKDMQES